MSIKVGLQYIEKWKESLELQVCRYEEEPVVKGQIVFYGASNFTRWSARWEHTPLREALPGKSGAPCAVNRGFGSSCAEHQLYYYPRMVRPLAPKVLVYSPFGNFRAFGYTLEETWFLAQRVIEYALADFPGIRIYICGPQYHRNDTEDTAIRSQKSNALVQEFVKTHPGCYFVDVFDALPLRRDDIFVADGVHYTQEGYDRYAEFFKEALKEELAEF